jgi:hypothetical protein
MNASGIVGRAASDWASFRRPGAGSRDADGGPDQAAKPGAEPVLVHPVTYTAHARTAETAERGTGALLDVYA